MMEIIIRKPHYIQMILPWENEFLTVIGGKEQFVKRKRVAGEEVKSGQRKLHAKDSMTGTGVVVMSD